MYELPVSLEPGERLLYVARRHPLTFWPRFAFLLVLAAIPAGFSVELLIRAQLVQGGRWRYVAAVVVLWVAVWVLRAARLKYAYDHQLWAVTNRRLIELSAGGPFHSAVAMAPLAEVQEVTTRSDGICARLFGYGGVECRTTGDTPPFVFSGIARPREVAQQLEAASQQARQQRLGGGTERL